MNDNSTNSNDQEIRLEWIQNKIVEAGHVTVNEAVSALKVSRMTIHRDLDLLHARGMLRKIRGGATAWTSSYDEPVVREEVARLQKAAIAKTAAGLVSRGDIIMCDESTTALGLVDRLKSSDMVTLITNFTLAIDIVVAKPGIRLIVVGGDYQPRYRAMVGTLALSTLADLRANIAFVSCMSIRGAEVYHQDQEIVALKRAMLENATIRVLLVDSTKLGSTALYRICTASTFDHIIVDDGISSGDLAQLRDSGANVHVARAINDIENG